MGNLIMSLTLSGLLLMPIPGVTLEQAFWGGYKVGRDAREAFDRTVDNCVSEIRDSVDWSKYIEEM